MSENRRQLRIERELLEVIAQFLHHGLKKPVPGLASVVRVDVSRDLRSAKVFIKFVGDEAQHREVGDLLEGQRADVQHYISQELKMKFCPVLKFIVNRVPADQIDEIDKLFAQLHRPRG